MSTRIAVTVTTLDGDDNFVPQEGLEQSNFKFIDEADNVSIIPFSGFSDQGNGNYVFYGFSIASTFPFKKAHIKINDVFQYGYGLFTLYTDNDESASQSYNDTRFGRLTQSNTWTGATNQFEGGLFGDVVAFEDTVTGQDFEMDTNSDLYLGVDEPQNPTLIWKKFADETYLSIDGTNAGNFVTLNTAQGISGAKEFTDITLNAGTNTISSPKIKIITASNPPNGGQTALSVGYNGSNKPDVKFHNSRIDSDGTGYVNRWKIKTTSNEYITGILSNDDYAHAKWIRDNFQTIGAGSYQSHTVIVDSETPENETLKIYNTINDAITDIIAVGVATDDRWTIYIRQPKTSAGFVEDIELPDFVNLIGEGVVRINGQFTRPATSEVLSSKIQNLHFTSGVAESHNLERLEAFNCIFVAGASVEIESSKLNNCELYGLVSITSGDNNKIKNCIGNDNVSWQTNDVVFRYDYVNGSTY